MMRILITGGSGFLGRHIVRYFRESDDDVVTLGRSSECEIRTDLSTTVPDLGSGPYDLVIHAAARAHVIPNSEEERRSFYQVNAEGTRRLLEALDQQESATKALILVSTVSVYALEEGLEVTEEWPTSADDPYGRSKALAEEIVLDWGLTRGVKVGVLRLPLVVGADAPGNLGAMIRALRTGHYVGVGDGSARRSAVLADDVARIIPRVAEVGGIYNLTDRRHPRFLELERAICTRVGRKPPLRLPLPLVRFGAVVGDLVLASTGVRLPLTSRTVSKMTRSLILNDDKAVRELGWKPRSVVDNVNLWV